MQRFRVDNTEDPAPIDGWEHVSTTSKDSSSASAAERAIGEVLQCEHVLVLAGLGTSLCIPAPPGDARKTFFPTMGDLWRAVRDAVTEDVLARVRSAVGYPTDNNIEDLLSRCLMKQTLDAGLTASASLPDIPAFIAEAEAVIRRECGKDPDESATLVHEDFLRRLVRRDPRRPRVGLFTTNYDVCFEAAAARIGLPIIDGFSFSVPPRFQPEVFDYDIITTSSYSKEPERVPRLLRLFKLHGSVDWDQSTDGAVIKKHRTANPVLIYPQSGKYAASYTPPFLEVMSRFQGLLRQRSIGVLAVSCGFNDRHISEPVVSAVKANPSLRLVVCAPDLCVKDARELYEDEAAVPAAVKNSTLAQFDHLIETGDARLTFINGRFPDVVKLIPTLDVKTDDEHHEIRIRSLEAKVGGARRGGAGT